MHNIGRVYGGRIDHNGGHFYDALTRFARDPERTYFVAKDEYRGAEEETDGRRP